MTADSWITIRLLLVYWTGHDSRQLNYNQIIIGLLNWPWQPTAELQSDYYWFIELAMTADSWITIRLLLVYWTGHDSRQLNYNQIIIGLLNWPWQPTAELQSDYYWFSELAMTADSWITIRLLLVYWTGHDSRQLNYNQIIIGLLNWPWQPTAELQSDYYWFIELAMTADSWITIRLLLVYWTGHDSRQLNYNQIIGLLNWPWQPTAELQSDYYWFIELAMTADSWITIRLLLVYWTGHDSRQLNYNQIIIGLLNWPWQPTAELQSDYYWFIELAMTADSWITIRLLLVYWTGHDSRQLNYNQIIIGLLNWPWQPTAELQSDYYWFIELAMTADSWITIRLLLVYWTGHDSRQLNYNQIIIGLLNWPWQPTAELQSDYYWFIELAMTADSWITIRLLLVYWTGHDSRQLNYNQIIIGLLNWPWQPTAELQSDYYWFIELAMTADSWITIRLLLVYWTGHDSRQLNYNQIIIGLLNWPWQPTAELQSDYYWFIELAMTADSWITIRLLLVLMAMNWPWQPTAELQSDYYWFIELAMTADSWITIRLLLVYWTGHDSRQLNYNQIIIGLLNWPWQPTAELQSDYYWFIELAMTADSWITIRLLLVYWTGHDSRQLNYNQIIIGLLNWPWQPTAELQSDYYWFIELAMTADSWITIRLLLVYWTGHDSRQLNYNQIIIGLLNWPWQPTAELQSDYYWFIELAMTADSWITIRLLLVYWTGHDSRQLNYNQIIIGLLNWPWQPTAELQSDYYWFIELAMTADSWITIRLLLVYWTGHDSRQLNYNQIIIGLLNWPWQPTAELQSDYYWFIELAMTADSWITIRLLLVYWTGHDSRQLNYNQIIIGLLNWPWQPTAELQSDYYWFIELAMTADSWITIRLLLVYWTGHDSRQLNYNQIIIGLLNWPWQPTAELQSDYYWFIELAMTADSWITIRLQFFIFFIFQGCDLTKIKNPENLVVGLGLPNAPEPLRCLILEDLQTFHIPKNKKLEVWTQYRLLFPWWLHVLHFFQENFEAKGDS